MCVSPDACRVPVPGVAGRRRGPCCATCPRGAAVIVRGLGAGRVMEGTAAGGGAPAGVLEGVQQCRFGGRAQDARGEFLPSTAPDAYPHKRLSSCATGRGVGGKAARDYNDWRCRAWPQAAQWVVNNSPRHCRKCAKSIERMLSACTDSTAGDSTAGDTAAGGTAAGGTAAGGQLEQGTLSELYKDAVCQQLLARVTSLEGALKAARKRLTR